MFCAFQDTKQIYVKKNLTYMTIKQMKIQPICLSTVAINKHLMCAIGFNGHTITPFSLKMCCLFGH